MFWQKLPAAAGRSYQIVLAIFARTTGDLVIFARRSKDRFYAGFLCISMRAGNIYHMLLADLTRWIRLASLLLLGLVFISNLQNKQSNTSLLTSRKRRLTKKQFL